MEEVDDWLVKYHYTTMGLPLDTSGTVQFGVSFFSFL